MKKRILNVLCIVLFLTLIIFVALNQEKYTYKTDEIDENLEKINLVDDLEILIDNDYFSYELLDETNEDYNETINLVKPISLNLEKNGYEASAFIYKIDEDYVYAASARHVLVIINGNINIVFHNDKVINTNIEYETLGTITDSAIFRFKTNNIPKEILYTLKQAYIDNEYYSQLIEGGKIIEYSENHCYPTSPNQQIKRVNLVNAYANADYRPYTDKMITTSRGVLIGMSGGPVLDYQGRIIGIVSYLSDVTHLDYHAKLDRLNELENNLINNK